MKLRAQHDRESSMPACQPQVKSYQVLPGVRFHTPDAPSRGVRQCAGAFLSSEFRLAHHPVDAGNVRLAAFLLFCRATPFFAVEGGNKKEGKCCQANKKIGSLFAGEDFLVSVRFAADNFLFSAHFAADDFSFF